MPNRDEAAKQGRPRRVMAIYWTSVAGLALAGVVVERIAVPWLIAMVHAGRGPAFLGRLMRGREHAPVEGYVAAWHDLARQVAPWLIGVCLAVGLGLLLWQSYRGAEDRRLEAGPPFAARPTDLFLLVVWFGVMTGIGEGYYLAAKLVGWREVVVNNWAAGTPSIWMAPLATTMLSAAAGFVLLAVLRWRRPVRALRWTALIGSFLLALTWIMMTARVHWIAGLLLALGLAIRLSSTMARQPVATARMVRRSLPALLAIALLMGIGERTLSSWNERRAIAALPSAADGAPNVIMIVLDTQRAASMSLYGFDRPTTPFLDELAGRAIVFDRAIAPENWTLPSHGTLFTSRLNTVLDVGETPLDDRFPTLAEVLRDHGYLTAGFVANLRFLNDELWGLARGFDHWSDQPLSLAMTVESSLLTRNLDLAQRFVRGDHTRISKKTAEQVNREFFAWRSRVADRPYFAFFNYFDVHNPYRPTGTPALPTTSPTPRYWLMMRDPILASDYTAEEIRDLRESYEAATAYLDARLRELFAFLEARGDLDNALVIITSDHGEQFGEHGLMEHRNSYYLPLLHVPLLIIPPGGLATGIRIDEPVSLADLPETVTHLLGIGPSPFLGASLARYWSASPWPGDPRPVFAGKYDVSIVQDRWHYIRTRQGTGPGHDVEELYDMVNDPDEERNLAGTSPAPSILLELRAVADSTGAKRPEDRSGTFAP